MCTRLAIDRRIRAITFNHEQVKKGGDLDTILRPHYTILLVDLARDLLPLEAAYECDTPFWTDSHIFTSRVQAEECWCFIHEFSHAWHYLNATLSQLELVERILTRVLDFYYDKVFISQYERDRSPRFKRKFYILFFNWILTSFDFSLFVVGDILEYSDDDLIWL
jgi:hypothetical protein